MRNTKYIIHFIQNDYNGDDRVGSYANAIEMAQSKEEAINQASTRAHFDESFLVQAHFSSEIVKTKNAMVKKYGHHKGIV